MQSDKYNFALIVSLFAVIISACLSFFRMDGGVLQDVFHYGEFFSALFKGHPNDFNGQLVIHGALDYLPGMFALRVFGEQHFMLPTWVMYQILNLVTVLFGWLVLVLVTRDRSARPLILLLWGVVGTQLVGYRDLLFIINLYIFLLLKDTDRSKQSIWLEIALGVACALGVFWSFDRGIAMAGAMLAWSIIELVVSGKKSKVLISFLLVILILSFGFDRFSIGNYFENLRILFETSDQWRYPFSWEVGLMMFSVYCLSFSAIYFLTTQLRLEKEKVISDYVFYVFLIVFFAKISTNRMDVQHFLMGIWVPLVIGLRCYFKIPELFGFRKYKLVVCLNVIQLLLVYGVCKSQVVLIVTLSLLSFLIILSFERKSLKIIGSLLVFIMFFLIAIEVKSLVKSVRNGSYDWALLLVKNLNNKEVLPEGVVWAASEILKLNNSCLFDFTNNGLMNGYTNLGSCGRFSYLVYGNEKYEPEFISTLLNSKPKVILYSTNHWSFSIDKKPMMKRFPHLNAVILEKYSREICRYGYCIRYLG
ncbi:hypothetical protein [Leeia oryzae]|uniref:hypothetical protein n=1 Tax=Leeia oryzae TaxID=356662 RepID=UPI00047541BC|nr:hypothetical protein [Leeia oryzae]